MTKNSNRLSTAVLLIVFFLSACSSVETGSWTLSGNQIISSSIIVGEGKELHIAAGSVISFNPGCGLLAFDGGLIRIEGTETNPVTLTSTSDAPWDGIVASGSGSRLDIDWLVQSKGTVQAKDGASLIIRDSMLYGYTVASPPILEGFNADSVSVERCIIKNFYEIHFYRTRATVSDSVLEDMIGDGIDFDNSPEECAVRNCTIRNASVSNVDGIDFGTLTYPYSVASRGAVESCSIYDISDKGLSVGELALGISINNTLIHNTGIGIASKDSSMVTATYSTITDCATGIHLYQEREDLKGGCLTGSELVVWNNVETAKVENSGLFSVTKSCIPNVAGTGNIDLNPGLNADYIAAGISGVGIQSIPGASELMLARAQKMTEGL